MSSKSDPKHSFGRKALCLGISMFLLTAIDASAAVVLTISATSSSATQITITAGSGTNTIVGSVNSVGPVSNGRLPSGTSWSGSTGNMKITSLDSESGFSAANFSVNGTSTLQYTHNGSPFGNVLNDIETYNPNNDPDEFRVGPSSSMTYPALSDGDTYGFTGSVTFDLAGGMTAAAFTNGSFDNPINGGNFTWVVAVVPEPSTAAIIFGCIALLAAGRRRLVRR